MLSVDQMKTIEYLATGYTVPEASREVGVAPETIRGWLKNNSEFVKELSSATDIFAKECLKNRSRAYRVMTKKITDKILEKIDNDELDNLPLEDLVKMLGKTVTTMREDEDTKKLPALTAIQNNIQVNANVGSKLQDSAFAHKFGELLMEINPEDIQNMVETQKKAEQQVK